MFNSEYIVSLCDKIDEFSLLEENWDGYGASVIDDKIITNTKKFLLRLLFCEEIYVDNEDIYPTPYGSLVIDIRIGKNNRISLEIGYNSIGYFTEVEGIENLNEDFFISDITPCDFKSIPDNLKKCIRYFSEVRE